AGIAPVVLEAKEGLALNNGTQFMTALGVLALLDAEQLARASTRACALSLEAIKGVPRSLDPRLHAARPHPGQLAVARIIREQIDGSEILALPVNTARVHTARTFLGEAEAILGREKSERCLTAAEGIYQLRADLAELLGSLRERIDREVGPGDGDSEEEVRRAAGARVLTRYVLAAQGIYEQVLSGALPASAGAARGHLEQALEQLQVAVPSY